MSLSLLIEEIIWMLGKRDYVWFRFTWSKIGSVEPPRWIVWLEGLSGISTVKFSDTDLHNATTKMLDYLRNESKDK